MTTKYQSEDLLAIMEDAGYRLTDTRRSIVSFLNRQSDGFTAEQVNDELLWVGRATVFELLKFGTLYN